MYACIRDRPFQVPARPQPRPQRLHQGPIPLVVDQAGLSRRDVRIAGRPVGWIVGFVRSKVRTIHQRSVSTGQRRHKQGPRTRTSPPPLVGAPSPWPRTPRRGPSQSEHQTDRPWCPAAPATASAPPPAGPRPPPSPAAACRPAPPPSETASGPAPRAAPAAPAGASGARGAPCSASPPRRGAAAPRGTWLAWLALKRERACVVPVCRLGLGQSIYTKQPIDPAATRCLRASIGRSNRINLESSYWDAGQGVGA